MGQVDKAKQSFWEHPVSTIFTITNIATAVGYMGVHFFRNAQIMVQDYRYEQAVAEAQHETRVQQLRETIRTDPHSLEKRKAGYHMLDDPIMWDMLGREDSGYTRENSYLLALSDNPDSRVLVQDVLREAQDATLIVVMDPAKPDDLHVITRDALETAMQSTIVAQQKNKLPSMPKVWLTGSSTNNAEIQCGRSGDILLHKGFFTAGYEKTACNLWTVADVIAHEVGHQARYQHLGTKEYSEQKKSVRESEADSLQYLTHRNYSGAARTHLRWLKLKGELEYNENHHPPHLERIQMDVGLLARDTTLTLEQRTRQVEELRQVDRELNTETPARFDLMRYYHDEFAKVQDGKTAGFQDISRELAEQMIAGTRRDSCVPIDGMNSKVEALVKEALAGFKYAAVQAGTSQNDAEALQKGKAAGQSSSSHPGKSSPQGPCF